MPHSEHGLFSSTTQNNISPLYAQYEQRAANMDAHYVF
jgi:hypothetical protein